MNIDSPFEQWRLKHMQGMAASPEIMTMLALAFEGGRVAQSQQEPVKCTCGYAIGHPLVSKCICSPPKPWVGLTDDERRHFNNRLSGSGVAEEIDALLKEKNT